MDNKHLMYCSEQKLLVGTWGGSILTGFTVRCCNCVKFFGVTEDVIKRGGSIYTVVSVRDLTCPYCGHCAPTKADQRQILPDHSYAGFDS